jgi:hypothetical protein
MPPTGKLPDAVIADFEQWIATGAVDPREGSVEHASGGDVVGGSHKDHWACPAPQQAEPPEVAEGEGGETKWQAEVDRFVGATLGEAGVNASPPADPRTLLRRLSYDLAGLPPTAEELDAFAAAAGAGSEGAAYAQAVDRLLESPRFGERWGRYWLDVARYADTKGYVFEEDRNYPTAYKYRDWVIAAFNADLPYDKFIVEQLAADKLGDRPRRRRWVSRSGGGSSTIRTTSTTTAST